MKNVLYIFLILTLSLNTLWALPNLSYELSDTHFLSGDKYVKLENFKISISGEKLKKHRLEVSFGNEIQWAYRNSGFFADNNNTLIYKELTTSGDIILNLSDSRLIVPDNISGTRPILILLKDSLDNTVVSNNSGSITILSPASVGIMMKKIPIFVKGNLDLNLPDIIFPKMAALQHRILSLQIGDGNIFYWNKGIGNGTINVSGDSLIISGLIIPVKNLKDISNNDYNFSATFKYNDQVINSGNQNLRICEWISAECEFRYFISGDTARSLGDINLEFDNYPFHKGMFLTLSLDGTELSFNENTNYVIPAFASDIIRINDQLIYYIIKDYNYNNISDFNPGYILDCSAKGQGTLKVALIPEPPNAKPVNTINIAEINISNLDFAWLDSKPSMGLTYADKQVYNQKLKDVKLNYSGEIFKPKRKINFNISDDNIILSPIFKEITNEITTISDLFFSTAIGLSPGNYSFLISIDGNPNVTELDIILISPELESDTLVYLTGSPVKKIDNLKILNLTSASSIFENNYHFILRINNSNFNFSSVQDIGDLEYISDDSLKINTASSELTYYPLIKIPTSNYSSIINLMFAENNSVNYKNTPGDIKLDSGKPGFDKGNIEDATLNNYKPLYYVDDNSSRPFRKIIINNNLNLFPEKTIRIEMPSGLEWDEKPSIFFDENFKEILVGDSINIGHENPDNITIVGGKIRASRDLTNAYVKFYADDISIGSVSVKAYSNEIINNAISLDGATDNELILWTKEDGSVTPWQLTFILNNENWIFFDDFFKMKIYVGDSMITQHLKSSIASIPVDIEIGNSISFEVELLNDYSIELDYVVKAVNPIINVNSQSFIAGENNVKLPEVTISYINGESGLFTSMKAKLTWSVKDILISDEVFFSDKEGKFNKLINIPDTLTEESHIILKYSGNVICNAPKAIFRTSLANFPIGDFDLAVANYCYRYGDKSCFIDSIIIQQDHVTTIETGDILEISIPGFMDEGTVESFISSSNFDGVFSDGMLRLTANKNFINDQVDIIKDIKINFDNTVSGNYKIFCKPIKASQSYSLKEGPSINTEIFDAGFYSAGNKLTTMVINSNPNFNGLEPEVFMIHTPDLIRGGDTLLFKITDDNAVWPSGDDESILVSNQNYNGNSYIKPYFYLNESDSQCIGLIFTDDSVVDSIAIFNLISQLQFVSNNTESKIEMKFSNSITSLSNFLIQNVSPKFNIIYRGNSDKKFIRIMRSENLDTLNKFEITGLPKGSLNGELVLSFQSTLNSAWSERGDEWEGKNEKSGQGQKLFYNLCKDSKDSVEQNFNLSDVVFQSGNSSGYGKIMLRGPNYSLYSEETIVIGSPKFSLPGNITLIPVLDNGKTYRIKGLKIEDDPFLAKRFESLKFLRKGMSINCVYPESFQIKNLVSTWDSLLFQFDGNILELVLDADPEDSIKFDIEFTLNNLPSVSKQGLSIMIKIDNLSLGAMGGTINVINPEINIDSNKVHCCWNNQDLNLANSLRGISDITEEHTLYVNLLDTTVSYNNLSDIKLYDYFPRIRSFADKPELCELFADFRSEQEDWFESIDSRDQGLPLLKSKDSWILHLPFFMSNPKTINQNICFSTLPGILDISEYSTNISNAFSLSINNLSIDFDSISIVKNIDADEYELILSDSCLLEVGHSFSTNNNDEAVFHFHNETLDFPWLSGKLTQNLQNSTFKWYSDAINPLLSDKLFEISEGKASVMAIATNDSSINDIFRYSDGKILSDFSIKTISDSLNLKGGLYLVRVNDSSGNSLPVIRQVLLDPLAPRIENPYIKDIERRFNSDYSLEIVDTNIYLNRKDNEDNPIQLSVEDSLYFPLLDNIYINDTKGVNGSLYFKSNFTDNFFEEFPLYRPIYLKNYFSIKTFLSEAKNEDKKTDSLIVEKNINDAQKLLVLSPINWGERGTYLFTYSDICGNVVCDTLILDFIKGAGSDGAILSKVINYPNPFMVSKGTRFRYSLGEDAESGRLIVFDAAGDLVFYQDLYQIMGITAGTHEFWWNGRDLFKGKLASGVYFGIFEVKGKFGSKQQRLKIAIQNL